MILCDLKYQTVSLVLKKSSFVNLRKKIFDLFYSIDIQGTQGGCKMASFSFSYTAYEDYSGHIVLILLMYSS